MLVKSCISGFDTCMIVGIIKPKGMTSHDVIYRLRKITGVKKIGHAGTLDPLASGVLIVGIGRESTKLLDAHHALKKEYSVHAVFGATSETGDAEGPLHATTTARIPSEAEVTQVVHSCVGKLFLIPPRYSAVKVRGVPSYKRARRKQSFELTPRESLIYSIQLLSYTWPNFRFRVVTGKGVYVRSLVELIGTRLSVGAYIQELERTRIGEYDKSRSYSLENFSIFWKKEKE